MSDEQNPIGDMFSLRRKELNLALKDVESATSIRTSYLQAIEDGHMDKLISPVYAQGFVKQYASFLGLDGERIVGEHPDLFKQAIQQDFAYGIGTLEMRGNPGPSTKGKPNAIWIGAFFILLFVAYYFARLLEVI